MTVSWQQRHKHYLDYYCYYYIIIIIAQSHYMKSESLQVHPAPFDFESGTLNITPHATHYKV